jgi:hypothetical protein
MKKILPAIVIFFSVSAFAQSESTLSYAEFHEPKINIGYLILGNFDVTYEYL